MNVIVVLKKKDNLIVVMEYGGNTNLKKFIEKYRDEGLLLEEKIIKDIIIQICNGLKEFHNNNIIYRDLNPYIIFIDNNHKIKILLPLPLSEYLDNKNDCSTEIRILEQKYIDPEIHRNKYTLKGDIWSLGCIIYELFTLNEYYIDIRLDKVKKINTDIYDPKWQVLINVLLKKDFRERQKI